MQSTRDSQKVQKSTEDDDQAVNDDSSGGASELESNDILKCSNSDESLIRVLDETIEHYDKEIAMCEDAISNEKSKKNGRY